ncbi:UNVERIFIED_CONTAM: hypothetical protein FKN15_056180 [Acipenser sinensis]
MRDSDEEHEEILLLYVINRRCRRPRRKVWVHRLLQCREDLGEFHMLIGELSSHEDKFFQYFRMSECQFNDILALLEDDLLKETIKFRKPIGEKERLAICLRFLATGDSYKIISFSYRVGKSTIVNFMPETKTGIALLYNEESNHSYDIRLKLTKEILTIQKQDVIVISGSESNSNGGAEHKVPVVISKIFKDQVADQTGMLFIGDAVLQMKMANMCCSPNDQVIHMGWASERLQGTDSSQLYNFKFLALKGSSLYIFSNPPVSTLDWVRAETIYNLCEVLFKVHKLQEHVFQLQIEDCWLQANLYLGLHQDWELRDHRPYCFSVMAGQGKSHYLSVELGSDLAEWEKSFQRAIFMEVQRTGSKTYMCSSQGKILCFIIDFGTGFTCFENISNNVLWKYKFSQLKGSSDDGKTRVKLLFQNSDTKQIEMKELEFADLTAVLHCIHSFIAAKVAAVDPVFIDSQSVARKYMYSS